MCRLIWEWIYAKQIEPQDTEGHFWVLGFTNQKVLGGCQTAGPICTKFGTHSYAIHLGMDRRQTNWPERHKGALGGGGLVGQTFKRQGKLSNGWTDWHKLWFRSADSSGNGHRLNTSRPSIPRGHVGGGGIRGSQIKKSWEAVKRLWIHLGMDTG